MMNRVISLTIFLYIIKEPCFYLEGFPRPDAGVALGAGQGMGLFQPLPRGNVGNMGEHYGLQKDKANDKVLKFVS